MIDAWQCKLLRRVMKVRTTYIDRSKNNEWVFSNSNSERLSATIKRYQHKYFAHVARHPSDIIHTVGYGPPHIPRSLNAHRRRGKLRHQWTDNVEASISDALRERGTQIVNR